MLMEWETALELHASANSNVKKIYPVLLGDAGGEK
jgi:hypothetical protein